MKIELKILSNCKANPCSYVQTKKGTWPYYLDSIKHFAPIRFHYAKLNCPNFKYHGFSIFFLRKYILNFRFNK